jgi:hypothetical protein
MMPTLIAASTNRVIYTPSEYPLSSLTVTATRDGDAVTLTGSVTPDDDNERYYLDMTVAESVQGLYRFAWVATLGSVVRTDVEYAICVEGERIDLLASPNDLVDFGYVDSDGVPSGWQMLPRASERVRRFTDQTVTYVEDDEVVLYQPYRLPQRPVVSVSSVKNSDGEELDASDWTLKPAGFLDISQNTGPVTVTYSHGFETLPGKLTELVCSIASRMAASTDSLAQGVRSEQAGGEMITYGADAYAGVTSLTSEEKVSLDRLFTRLPRTVDIL